MGSHGVEHAAELLNVRLAGCVVDCCRTFGKDGGHDDVCRTCDRGFVEQHVRTVQTFSRKFINAAFGVLGELRTQFLETEEMGVETAAADFIASRF